MVAEERAVRDAIADGLERYMDSPARRFIEDVAIPTLIIGTIIAADIIAPYAAPATAPALAAAATRLAAGPLVRAAAAWGATALYKSAKDAVDGLASSRGESGPGRDRIQNTPQEVRSYLKGIQETGCLGNWKKYGKYWAAKFNRDCSYKENSFKRGEFLGRDRLHHEAEWFRNESEHLGAIEPKCGTKYKQGDPSKRLRE
jgi:hypothetical protein